MIPGVLATALCVLLTCGIGLAASIDPVEEMFGDTEQEEDFLSLLAVFDTALKQPVNLLRADRNQISALPWVSPWLADKIIALRRSGDLRSVDDLTKIEGVSERLVRLLGPFVVVEAPARKRLPIQGRLRLRAISSPTSSSVKNLKTYLHSDLSLADLTVGCTLEKDRCESRFNDFQSYYIEKKWPWGKVTIGNLVLTSGHGLVFSKPYGYSPSTVSPWRFSRGDFGIEPYSSVDENFTLTGCGLSITGESYDLCLVASRTGLDANLDEAGLVTSIRTTGYHITEREAEAKDALEEDLLGMAARWKGGRFGVGLSISSTAFDKEFAPGKLGYLASERSLVGGVDLFFTGEGRIFFVEGASAEGGGTAFLGGLVFDRSSVEFLLLGRDYDEKFVSFHSRPFSFYSGFATGEEGLFTRLAFKPVPNGLVSIGNDLHRKQGTTNGVSGPSGSETYLDLKLDAGRLMLAVAEKLARVEEPPSSHGDVTQERSRLRSRLDITFEPAGSIWLRLRYERLRSEEIEGASRSRSCSDLLRFDMRAAVGRDIGIKAGFYTFGIADYASRIYQYESGLPFYPSFEMLKSDGSRWYCVLLFGGRSVGKVAMKAAKTVYRYDADRFELLFSYNLRI
jgi:hypothetical protein